MANEPITLYANRIDLAGVAALLRRLAPGAQVVGPSQFWEKIVVSGKRKLFRKPATLTFVHDPGFYEGPEWASQRQNLQDYFQAFPEAPRKSKIIEAIAAFRFALAAEFAPDFDPAGDERLNHLFAVAKHLGALLVTPTSLRDWEGRVLLAEDGDVDDDAELPGSNVTLMAARRDLRAADDERAASAKTRPPSSTKTILKQAAKEMAAPKTAPKPETLRPASKTDTIHPASKAVVPAPAADPGVHRPASRVELSSRPLSSLDEEVPETTELPAAVARRDQPAADPPEIVPELISTLFDIPPSMIQAPAEVYEAEEAALPPAAADTGAAPLPTTDDTQQAPAADTAGALHDWAPIETQAAPALVPPQAGRVARRALVLAAVAARGLLEQQDHADPEIEAQRQRLAHWLESLDLGTEPESEEWHILQCPVGTLDDHAAIEALWRFESLVVLAWALGLAELPPHDRLVDPGEVLPCVGFLSRSGADEFLATASLRPPQQINGFAHIAFALHWRLHEFALRPGHLDFVAFANTTWFGPLDETHIRLLDGDLALGEHTLNDAPHESVARALSTAQERHKAANWLCGFSQIYSQTDSST